MSKENNQPVLQSINPSKKLSEKELLFQYLDEVLSTESSKLVGKVMKRYEIMTNLDMLKKETRELIYESFRELKDIFYAYEHGLKTWKIEFKTVRGENGR